MKIPQKMLFQRGKPYSGAQLARILKIVDFEEFHEMECVFRVPDSTEDVTGHIYCEEGSHLYVLNNTHEGDYIGEVEGWDDEEIDYMGYDFSWIILNETNIDFLIIN